MLKRCQILITDWQVEHFKLIAKRNDLSFSEMIRIVLCEGLLHTSRTLYPEYKSKVSLKELSNIATEGKNLNTSMARKHQLASKLYFEARKAIEYINERIKKELALK